MKIGTPSWWSPPQPAAGSKVPRPATTAPVAMNSSTTRPLRPPERRMASRSSASPPLKIHSCRRSPPSPSPLPGPSLGPAMKPSRDMDIYRTLADTMSPSSLTLLSGMQGGPVYQFLDVAVERPGLDQFQVEVGRTLEDRVQPGLTGDHREERHLDAVDQTGGHQRPVHRQAAVRAQRYLGLLLEPGDDVDGVAAHDGRIRPVEGSFQCGRHHRCRQAPHPGDPWVTHLGLLGARGQHPRERPIRVGPEDHPLLLAVQGEAVVEQLGALLAPVAGPVAAGGAEAVEAGKDVECVGRGHDALLEWLIACSGDRPGTTAKLIVSR